MEISSYLSELSDAFKDAVNGEFERFGVEVVNFFCEDIAPHPEDYEKLRQYKEDLVFGKDFYQRRRSLDIAEKLAAKSSSNGIFNPSMGVTLEVEASKGLENIFSEIGQNLYQSDSEKKIICQGCGAKNNASMKFCGNCGSKLVSSIICPYCGREVQEGMNFCGECGKPLSGQKCPCCGFENKPGTKFCGNCGEKL